MRIIAGDFGGRRLHAPKGLGTRPTSDRVKESLFSVLGAPTRARVVGSDEEGVLPFRVLDLFAGSGALGLEALSRGADEAVFVEEGREALAALERNIADCGVVGRARVVRGEVGSSLRNLDGAFDWVFLDPPYDKPGGASGPAPLTGTGRPAAKSEARSTALAAPRSGQRAGGFGPLERALRLLGATSLCRGLVLAEHDARVPPADRYGRLALVARRRWGDTAVSFYRTEPDALAASEGAPE